MTKVHIAGLRGELDDALEALHRAGAVELTAAHREDGLDVVPVSEGERLAGRAAELRTLLSRLDELLEFAKEETGLTKTASSAAISELPDTRSLARELEDAAPPVRAAAQRLDRLRDERAGLTRCVEPLEHVLPLSGELADLDGAKLAGVGLDIALLILETEGDTLVEFLLEELAARLDTRFELVLRRVDSHTVACLLAYPHRESAAVRELLAHDQIRHVAVSERYERLSPSDALEAMKRRLAELPAEFAEAHEQLRRLVGAHLDCWVMGRLAVLGELDRIEARSEAGLTERAFVLAGWTPTAKVAELRERLERELGLAVVVEPVRRRKGDPAPVLLSNPRPARPFETLVRLFELPRAGTLDPTVLLALFVPLMFGVMVGDVVYGTALLAIAVWLRRRFSRRSPVLADVARILTVGSAWAIVFGFLFGEALGNFGQRHLGLDPLWFYRAGADAIEPLFLLVLGIGGAHVMLGLLLGIGLAAREGERRELATRIATLVAIAACLALAAIAVEIVHPVVTVPAVVAMLLGLVVMSVVNGVLGAVTGPIELVGAVANVLSYLRLAAVGLASAYLANVANEFAVELPLAAGLMVAALLHVLNLALVAFSPLIQSLRLHYVEFFSKFYEGGGRAFRPFGGRVGAPPTARPVAILQARA